MNKKNNVLWFSHRRILNEKVTLKVGFITDARWINFVDLRDREGIVQIVLILTFQKKHCKLLKQYAQNM